MVNSDDISKKKPMTREELDKELDESRFHEQSEVKSRISPELRKRLDEELDDIELLDRQLAENEVMDGVKLQQHNKIQGKSGRRDGGPDTIEYSAGLLTGGKNSVSANPDVGWSVEDIKPILGNKEIDWILSIPKLQLNRFNQLRLMWGCSRCFMRGTRDCPYDIADGLQHANGYCDFAIKYHIIQAKLMGKVEGLRYLRNNNILVIKELADHYKLKLNERRKSDSVTKEEAYLLKSLLKLLKEMGDRMDNAIKQDEGIKVEHMNRELTPEDIDKLFQAGSVKVDGRTE